MNDQTGSIRQGQLKRVGPFARQRRFSCKTGLGFSVQAHEGRMNVRWQEDMLGQPFCHRILLVGVRNDEGRQRWTESLGVDHSGLERKVVVGTLSASSRRGRRGMAIAKVVVLSTVERRPSRSSSSASSSSTFVVVVAPVSLVFGLVRPSF